MSSERVELPGEEQAWGWREHLADVSAAASRLFATRLAIFREELSVKAFSAAKGFAFVVVAAAMAVATLLSLAALLTALFAKLFGGWILGILGTVVLYGAGAAGAAWAGVRAFSRARPFDFPATAEELSRDRATLSAALAQAEPEAEVTGEAVPSRRTPVDDLEDRFRAGSE
jgi:uncharacterized membrane protein YqjE